MTEQYKILLEKGKQAEAIEELYKKYKKANERTDLLLKIAIIKFNVPMYDFEGALNSIDEALQTNKEKVKALILKTIIEYYSYGEVSDETYRQVSNIKIRKKDKSRYTNQIDLLKAFYYKSRDDKLYYDQLLKAIENDPSSSHHYYLLSKYYNSKGKKVEALKSLNQAISNITKVYAADEDFDESDVDDFINEYVKGTEISKINYEGRLEMKEKLESRNKTKN